MTYLVSIHYAGSFMGEEYVTAASPEAAIAAVKAKLPTKFHRWANVFVA